MSVAMDGTTQAILRQIESLGFRVSVFENPGSLLGLIAAFVEMHAIDTSVEPPSVHISRVVIADHTNPHYSCACLLARSVGIQLDD